MEFLGKRQKVYFLRIEKPAVERNRSLLPFPGFARLSRSYTFGSQIVLRKAQFIEVDGQVHIGRPNLKNLKPPHDRKFVEHAEIKNPDIV